MATNIVPGIYDPSIADGEIEIATEDAHAMALRLAREEGFLVGVSSGANMVAATKIALALKDGRELAGGECTVPLNEAVVVTIFCDSAAKYLSESFWREKSPPTDEAENWP